MATPSEVRALFEERLKEGIPNPPGEFHPLDLERVKDDKYLKRVIKHMAGDAKAAANMLWDILLWRKSVGANDINESTIKLDYLNEGAFFTHGRDIDGCLLLIFKAKSHIKGTKDFEELKKLVIYWLDRVEREENGNKITLFFDMDGAGLKNMDIELVKYLISLLKLYYPHFLNKIIIYQMAWILSAAFNIIKQLLPAQAVEIMKFVGKDNLKDIVPLDQALTCWGGTSDYQFVFVPESKNEHTPKKVTFAEQGDNKHSLGEMLLLNPNDTILFQTENDEISGSFTIKNMDDGVISFKIRTTTPEKFRVRPSSGVLAKGQTQTVVIVVQPGYHVRTVSKERFLVLAVQIPRMDLTPKELGDIWKNSSGSKTDEYRLKCNYPEKESQKNGSIVDGRIEEKPDSVSSVLNSLQTNYDRLNKQVRWLKIFQLLTLLLTAFAAYLCFLVYNITLKDRQYCEKI